ncbi:MAG: hypothetical protein ABSD21_08820 [Rhizomicrobium sp.]|jgi:hypothetical protein
MAGRGSGDGTDAGAARQFALRHRVLLLSSALSVIGIATGVATANAILGGASLGDAGLILAGAALAGAVSLLHTRHLALAFLTAAAPLPGLVWAAPMSADSTFGVVPVLAYAFAYAVSVMQAHNVLVRTLDGGATEHPFKPFAAVAGLMTALALLWFWRAGAGTVAFQAVLDVVLAAASVLIVMPIGESVLHFDEAFVVAANRARERRQRLLEKIAMIAVPRWGMSIAGIALVFVALAWFGAEPAFSFVHFANAEALLAASLGLTFALAVPACGGWREGFAATVVAGLAGLVALWGFAAIGIMAPTSPVGVLELVSVALFLAFCGARRAAAHRRLGDDPPIARLRAVEDLGGPQFFAILGGLGALLPVVVVHPAYAAYMVALVFAGAGALGFAPALTTACELLLPRRRSVEELYGRR